MKGHKTTIIEGWSNKELFGIRVCMSVNVGTNVTCPVAMITDLLEVTLVDQVVFHVAEHSDRTRSHATTSETFGVKLDIGLNGGELHDGGEIG